MLAPALRLFEALHGYSAGGASVNMMMEEGDARVRVRSGQNHDRLARIERELDPDDLFRVNQNIPPVSERASPAARPIARAAGAPPAELG